MTEPERHDIPRRSIHFNIDSVAADDWLGGDRMASAVVDGLSAILPVGERFFIRTLQHYQRRYEGTALGEEIRAFCHQEALHTREHEAYNRALRRLGHDVDSMEAATAARLDPIKSRLQRLAATAGLEHITAAFAQTVLRNPRLFAEAPAPYRELWSWHSVEELEHRGVAHVIYQDVCRELGIPAWRAWLLRCLVMCRCCYEIARMMRLNSHKIIARDQPLSRVRSLFGMLRVVFGRPGFYRLSLPYVLRYFVPGFDPWKAAPPEELQAWQAYFDDRIKSA